MPRFCGEVSSAIVGMMTDFNFLYLGLTLGLAAAAIGVTLALPQNMRSTAFYAQLVLMVGIYIGFALAGLDEAAFVTRASVSGVLVESLSALFFMFAGLMVLTQRPWALGVLILAHGGVDLLHMLVGSSHSPDWYEFLCLIYDAIVGVAAIWMLSADTAKN
ncbi:MAG: hypothetical protein DHS20C05_18030 [Hyphococcus sp.]|nr:MAG: hypothetical protein DHS20C05_18030 [Marinicaulis sp.]